MRALLPAALCCAVALVSCHDATGPSDKVGPLAHLSVVSGDGQQAPAGSELPQPVVVRATDAAGRPVPNRVVNFVVVRGGGHVFAGAAQTNADGVAQERWTLGTVAADSQKLEVRAVDQATGSPIVYATFLATATPGAPASLLRVAGDSQLVEVGSTASDTLVVRLVDAYGNAIRSVAVRWTIAAGSGTVTAIDATTDSTGRSRARLTVGNAAGVYAVTAGVEGGPTATFVARGVPGAAVSIALEPRSVTLGALRDTVRLHAIARDRFGNTSEAQASWRSLDTVATIDAAGLATATANGQGRIVATAGTVADTAAITVRQVARTLALDPALATISIGEGIRLALTAADSNGFAIAERSWRSDNAAVADVDADGIVRGRSAGAARITATTGGRDTAATIIVRPGSGLPGMVAVAVGDTFSCGLSIEGVAYCWGANTARQLGTSDSPEQCYDLRSAYPVPCSTHPTAVAGGLRFSRLTAGKAHACALTAGGDAYCWGADGSGQAGRFTATCDPNHISRCVPEPHLVGGGHQFATLAAGDEHTCALTAAGEAWCWGRNREGQLGDGNSGLEHADNFDPVAVAGGHKFAAIAPGVEFTCGTERDTGAAYCWGNSQNLPGAGVTPTLVAGTGPGGIALDSIGAGEYHACALGPYRRAYCWGSQNNFGQLGVAGTAGGGIRPVDGNLAFVTLSVGQLHSCAIDANGATWCWGSSGWGQRGDGTLDNAFAPTPVSGGLGFATIDAGPARTCATSAAGVAYCWGSNLGGALGIGVAPTTFDFESQRRTVPNALVPR